MKKTKLTALALASVFFLAACGEGNDNEAVSGSAVDNGNDNADMNNEPENVNNEADNEGNEEPEENNEENHNEEEANEEEDVAMIDQVTLYFSDDQLLETYRYVTDESVTMDEDGAMDAFGLWLEGAPSEDLLLLAPEGTTVQSISFDDETAVISFSPELNDANLGSSGAMMLTEHIAMMFEQFGIAEVFVEIDGEQVENFLGHMSLEDPLRPGDPDEYPLYE
ncbi:GerMN domain-containing protein [Salisediminibacterium selenitireducens]|uniref:Lipoprotein LpqB, GerMN domain protein n=1 Tax=Bacillus selenitireducens (strain ATCC 700615 / DSM 15326 / MLS10) TaxID=439292 RepID=D6XXX6_BACIE|nr:GerMN domain-containing protein [Salisediminibacterium selenitireducens]ADH98049.1 Lipoprotein LpqB, GerMN domain protein [[Bacillus] selenitireducens MLS10]